MFSSLRKGLLYENISPDIVEHDLDVDADQWSYDGKDVYRGSVDPDYLSKELNVYWLYDDNLKRVGLAEHEAKEPEVFKVLWFYDNPFATLYQDESWKSTGSTLWSKLSNEAYQDYLEGLNVYETALNSGVLLMTPKLLVESPTIYGCETCGKKSFEKGSCSQSQLTLDFPVLFIDDDFILYERVTPHQQPDAACVEAQSSEQVESPDQQESLDELTRQLESPEPQ